MKAAVTTGLPKAPPQPTRLQHASLGARKAYELSNAQTLIISGCLLLLLTATGALWQIRHRLEVESLTRRYTRALESAFSAGTSAQDEAIKAIRLNQGKMPDSHAAYISTLITSTHSKQSAFARELAGTIVKVSRDHKLDPFLVTAVIEAESTFKLSSVSTRGALGLMQVKPETGAYITGLVDSLKWRGASHLQNPSYNVEVGVAYLRYLLKKFDNNTEKALMAYNWGPGNLSRALKGGGDVPASTRSYAKKIMGKQKRWHGELKQAQLVLSGKQLA